MIRYSLILVMTLWFTSCVNSQPQNQIKYTLLGGPCEGCEAIFEYGAKKLNAVDTLPDFHDPGIKIKITGTIYQKDGKSPAEGVILYIYHTDQNGLYATRGNETGWARRHGYIRGWIKTDRNGQYAFYTLKPGVYQDRSEPAHIHPILLEPNGTYYWLGSYYFMGDQLLTDKHLNTALPRGGSSGVLHLKKEGAIWVGTRNLVLGKNVPGYDSSVSVKTLNH